jgi:hypothetical protein
MPAQQIVVFLAHASVIALLQAQTAADAACERYASNPELIAPCDKREFVPQPEPVIDIGDEAAITDRARAPRIEDDTLERIWRPDEPTALAAR